jgi:hypothetical protein
MYSFLFLALMGMRETMSSGTGPVSDTLGKVFNQALKSSSKLGLGLALMSADKQNENTMVGRYSHQLGVASHKAYVSSAKVDLFSPAQ